MKNNSYTAAAFSLATMSREELRNVARLAGVKRGKNGKDTAANLLGAIREGKIQFKSTFVIASGTDGLLPNQPIASNALFQKKFRSYGGGDKVEFPRIALA